MSDIKVYDTTIYGQQGFAIEFNELVYIQRTVVAKATDGPIMQCELITIALCEKITALQAENDLKTSECKILNQQINALLENIKSLQTDNENLKCCGNCVHCFDCAQMREQDLLPYNSCEYWQWDNMTIEERIK